MLVLLIAVTGDMTLLAGQLAGAHLQAAAAVAGYGNVLM
jgi:hypothetical protein